MRKHLPALATAVTLTFCLMPASANAMTVGIASGIQQGVADRRWSSRPARCAATIDHRTPRLLDRPQPAADGVPSGAGPERQYRLDCY